jgi:hypothetical protein
MLRRVATALLLTTGISIAAVTSASADSPPPHQVLSNFENYFGASLARDCGFSQPVPGKPGTSLWLFCDTPEFGYNSTTHTWGFITFIPGSTAAEGPTAPNLVPTDLSELTSANTPLPAFPNHDGPAQFLPTPSGLVTDQGTPCVTIPGRQYPASWISGVTRDPATPSDLLISFDNYCVQADAKPPYLPEGFDLAVYDPATNAVTSTAVFTSDTAGGLPAPQVLNSPVLDGSYLYFFNYFCKDPYLTCGASSKNAVYVARVRATPAAWKNPAAYQWATGKGTWSSSASKAKTVIPGVRALGGISAGNYHSVGQPYVLIAQTSIGGNFTVYEASSPAGPWKVKLTGTVPCTSGPPGSTTLCHAIIGHPDLSTRASLFISFLNPGAGPSFNPDGHVEVAAFAW